MASTSATLSKITKKKTTRKLNLETKLKIIEMLEKGSKISEVARLHNLNESTIRTIKSNTNSIKLAVREAIPTSSKLVKYTRDSVMVKMEKLLVQWIEDNNKKHIGMDTRIIQSKALSIFNQLKEKSQIGKDKEGIGGKSSSFVASKGWFDKFKKRYNFHNIKFMGEAASADVGAASEFVRSLRIHLKDNGYSTQQVFNADETGLFWKRLPSRTFISKEEKTTPGFKCSKDRLTLLFCGNASGCCKCKPLLIYHSANPRVLKNIDKSRLPVHWKSNKKSWMTAALFEDWFSNIFCPEVEEYCRVNKIPFKILLLVDNAPSHSETLNRLNPNVKVMFMPPNTTSLIQPMDQGVIACFKKHYLKHTFKQMFDMLEENKQLTLRDFWRNYNIADALENINKGWKDVTETTMNAVWKNLWPDCIRTDSVSLVEAANEDVAETIAVGRQLEAEGFSDLNLSDIEEYIESHDVELETNDLIELSEEYKDKEQDIEDALRDDVKESTYLFTTPNIKEYIAMIQTAIDFITKIDPDIERSCFIRRGLQAQIAPYDLIIKERQQASKQQTIDKFLMPSTSSCATGAQTGTTDAVEYLSSEED